MGTESRAVGPRDWGGRDKKFQLWEMIEVLEMEGFDHNLMPLNFSLIMFRTKFCFIYITTILDR